LPPFPNRGSGSPVAPASETKAQAASEAEKKTRSTRFKVLLMFVETADELESPRPCQATAAARAPAGSKTSSPS
jgi:hypothetical protein